MARKKLEIKFSHLYEDLSYEDLLALQKELDREIKKKEKEYNQQKDEELALKKRDMLKIDDKVSFELKGAVIEAIVIGILADKVKVSFTDSEGKERNKALPYTRIL